MLYFTIMNYCKNKCVPNDVSSISLEYSKLYLRKNYCLEFDFQKLEISKNKILKYTKIKVT